jgi:transcriptional regulator with XRE-family HTH domain
VIDVALLSIIRRWHIRDQVPLREIARRLRISRNTVRRYLRAEITEPAYAVRRSRSAIDKYAFQLSAMLKTEAARSRKQRRTLKQIHEDLRELGFEGSYDRVAAFARVWREGQTERVNPSSKRTYIPLAFAPGEAFQFDWSEDWAVINGERTKLQVAHLS